MSYTTKYYYHHAVCLWNAACERLFLAQKLTIVPFQQWLQFIETVVSFWGSNKSIIMNMTLNVFCYYLSIFSMLKTVIVLVSHPMAISGSLGWVCRPIRSEVPDLSANQSHPLSPIPSWTLYALAENTGVRKEVDKTN